MKPGQEFFNPSNEPVSVFDLENKSYAEVEYGQVITFLSMRPTNNIINNSPPTAIVEFEDHECWIRLENFKQLNFLESQETSNLQSNNSVVFWMSNNSTYETLDLNDFETGPTITTLTKEAIEEIEAGMKLKDFDIDDIRNFVIKHLSLTKIVSFYLKHHPNAL